MRKEFFDRFTRTVTNEALLNRHHNLRYHLQIAIREHIQRVRDDSFRRVLNWHHAVVCAVAAYLRENVGHSFLSRVFEAGAEFSNSSLMGEGRFRTEISDDHRFLER